MPGKIPHAFTAATRWRWLPAPVARHWSGRPLCNRFRGLVLSPEVAREVALMLRVRAFSMLLAIGMSLPACSSSAISMKDAAMRNATASNVNLMPVKRWPLRFESHKFSVFTYDTYGAKVIYAKQVQVDESPHELQRSSDSYGTDYRKSWTGIHGMIRNFPPPAMVTWRSRDGQAHRAEIDIGGIFEDELIRHNVPREAMADVPDGEYRNEPSIILEVNDRTIRVWMRAWIPLKNEIEIAGHMRKDRRYDLILAKSYTY